MVLMYHQCVKGHLGMKPLRIAANQTLFNYMKTSYVDTQFYEEFTSVGGGNEFELVGMPLLLWEDLKKDLKQTETEEVHKRFVEKRKRNKEMINTVPKPKCIKILLSDGKVIYRL